MSTLGSAAYRRVLDMAVAALESTDRIPWKGIIAGVREQVGGQKSVVFYSRDWLERPPTGHPLPWMARLVVWGRLDDAIQAHPLLAAPAVAGIAASDDLPAGIRLPRGAQHRDELDYFGTHRHLAISLPAPPGASHVLMMGLGDGPLRPSQREFCQVAAPVLAAVARHERRLDQLAAAHGTDGPPPAMVARRHGITPRELTVLHLLAQALTAQSIAHRLGVSPRTVHNHIQRLYRKLDTTDRLATVLCAQQLGLLPRPLISP